MDAETRAERNIDSAARHAQQSSRHLFIAGYQAAKIYGLYQVDATREIAARTGRSVTAVQNWVYAYRCFVSCLQVDLQLARKLRRALTMTHFQRMYAISEKHNLTGDQQCYFLSLMIVNKTKGEPYGPDTLEQEIDIDLRYAGLKPDRAVDWRYHWSRLQKPLELLASFDGELPEEVKRRILELLVLFDESYR